MPWLGYAFALGAATLFALGGIIAKYAFASGILPSELAEFRVLFAFLVYVVALAALRPSALRIRRRDLPLIATFGVFGLGAIQWSYYEAIGRLPIGIALVIQYTGPLLMLVWVRVRGRRVGGRLWVAALLALVGSFFVVGAYDQSLRALNAAGAAFAALSAVIYALYFLLAERILSRYSHWTLLAYGFGFALLGWAILHPLWTLPWPHALSVAPLMLGVVFVASVFPFALTFAALRLLPAPRVGLVSTFEPVVAAGAAWLLLSETLSPAQLGGGLLVMVAIVMAQSLRPTAGSV